MFFFLNSTMSKFQDHKFPDGTFFVRCVQNGLYLGMYHIFLFYSSIDAKGEGKYKGTPVIVWEYNGQTNQR